MGDGTALMTRHHSPCFAPAPASRSRPSHDVLSFGVFSLIFAGFGAQVIRFWWLTDDAYVSFRFSRNLSQGLGLRYNLGEQVPVEGYSNFLWVLIGSVYEWLRLDIAFWLPLTSAACGAALLWLVFDRLYRELALPLVPAALAAAFFGLSPQVDVWATGGLATMPFALFVFLTFDRLILRRAGVDVIGAGCAGVMLTLIRVEGIAWFAVIFLLAGVSRWASGQWREAARSLSACGLVVVLAFGAYFAWRFSYYGELLPNTAHAKAAASPELFLRGIRYVQVNALTFLTPLVVLPGLWVAFRAKRIVLGPPVLALAWAFPIYAVVVTGDYMPMGRFLIPGLAFNAILFAWILEDVATAWPARNALAASMGVAIVGVGLLPAFDRHVLPESTRLEYHYRLPGRSHQPSEYTRWIELKSKTAAWRRRGVLLRRYAETSMPGEEVSMAIKALGAIGYETNFRMYDAAGLIVPEVARRRVTGWRKQPGHDKAVDVRYFVKERPTILLSWTINHKGGRAQIAEKVEEKLSEAMQGDYGPELRRLYAPDFVRMRRDSESQPPRYLLVMSRVPQSEVDERWRLFDRQLRNFVDKDELREIPG